MKKIALFLVIPIVLMIGVFLFFMSKNNWDFTVTRHVIGYEISQLTGKGADGIKEMSDEVQGKAKELTGDETEDTNSAENPEFEKQLYKENGKAVYSDVKQSHSSKPYTPKE